jgi:hypothetical protein
MSFHSGQLVLITYGSRTLEGEIAIASPNQRSLMLRFDGALIPSHGEGMFLGWMPVLRDEAGVYRDLMNNEPVQVVPRVLQ